MVEPAPLAHDDERAPKVLISYSHDDAAHETFVLALANRLRADGVESWIDQYVTGAVSWMSWMREQIAQADFVLIVCTEVYRRRAEGEEAPGRGRGVAFESALIMGYLYEASMRNDRFLPVVVDGAPDTVIPRVLRFDRRFSLDSNYDLLRRTLFGEAAVPVPPVVPRRNLPPPLTTTAATATAPASPAVLTGNSGATSSDRPSENTIKLFVADAGVVAGSSMAVVACLHTDQPQAIARAFDKLKEQLVRDPALAGLPAVAVFNGARGSLLSDDPDVRARVYERLGAITARIFVCCRPLGAGEVPGLVFLQLLGRLLFDRLRAYRTRPIEIAVESAGVAKTEDDVGAVVGSCTAGVRARHDLADPLRVAVTLGSGQPAAAAAVYAAQAVKARLEAPSSLEARAFERLRSKVQVIHRLDTRTFYDRRNQVP